MTVRGGNKVSQWNDSLATGVPLLDEQHQALFLCLSELEKAATQQAMLATVHAMEKLSRYVKDHFAAEERLMKLHGYPDLAGHLQEHRSFSDKLFELRKSYLDHDISTDLIAFLRDWLECHVAGTDMGYVPYLQTAHRHLESERAAAEAGGKVVNLLEW